MASAHWQISARLRGEKERATRAGYVVETKHESTIKRHVDE
jgi:hypothetical protein